MSERAILARIREALAVAAPVPGNGHGTISKTPVPPSAADQRRVLPAVGQSFDEQLALFRKNAAELRAGFQLCQDLDGLAAELKKLCVARAGSGRPRTAAN